MSAISVGTLSATDLMRSIVVKVEIKRNRPTEALVINNPVFASPSVAIEAKGIPDAHRAMAIRFKPKKRLWSERLDVTQ
jgi:hypothetical protein